MAQIINRAQAGSQINLLCMIYKVLFRNPGKFNDNEIYTVCSPETLYTKPDHKKRFRTNLNFWAGDAYQLWKLDENDRYKLVENHDSNDIDIGDISFVINKKLFANIDEGFLEVSNKEVAPLFRCLAFIYSLEKYFPIKGKLLTKDSLNSDLQRFFPSYQLNDDERVPFLEYCHFLGFISPDVNSTSSVVGYTLDPTKAISSFLGDIFKTKNKLTIEEFLLSLSSYLPVLDGGYYKQSIEEFLTNKYQMDFSSFKLSSSLSHAIQRLYFQGSIKYKYLSDDKSAKELTLPDGPVRISEIEINSEASL